VATRSTIHASDDRLCRVLHCGRAADSHWSLAPWTDLTALPVCSDHRAMLGAGAPFATRRGTFSTYRRWLLLGADLDAWRATGGLMSGSQVGEDLPFHE